MNRRNFLQTTATSLAFSALPILPALSHNSAQYKTTLVGLGWWGMNILRCAIQAGESKVVALCDVDEKQLKNAVRRWENSPPTNPKRTVIIGNIG